MDLFKALGTTPLSGFQTLVITLITFIHTAVRLTSSKHPYHSLAASMRNVWKCPLKLGLDCYFKQNNGFRSVRDIRPLISCEFQYLINVSGCITQPWRRKRNDKKYGQYWLKEVSQDSIILVALFGSGLPALNRAPIILNDMMSGQQLPLICTTIFQKEACKMQKAEDLRGSKKIQTMSSRSLKALLGSVH